jgi:hypothetical protein
VFPERYELVFHISEDDILHSHSRGNRVILQLQSDTIIGIFLIFCSIKHLRGYFKVIVTQLNS